MMRKILFILLSFLSVLIILPSTSYAAGIFDNACNGSGSTSALCQDQNMHCQTTQGVETCSSTLIGPGGLITQIATIISLVAGIAAVIVIIISGLMFITSGGDPQRAQSARGALTAALIGVAIIALAESIFGFLLSHL